MSEVSFGPRSDPHASEEVPKSSSTPPPPTPSAGEEISHRKPSGFFILSPELPAAQKILYESLPESSLRPRIERNIDEVIGEYEEDGIPYYYARYAMGVAYRYHAESFVKKYEDLVMEYKRKQANGELEPFDPSAQHIHPLSRVRVKLSMRKPRSATTMSSTGSISSHGDLDIVPDSQEEDETSQPNDSNSSNDDSGDDYVRSGQSRRVITRSTRQTLEKRKKDLPFSPKKSRSRQLYINESDQGSHDRLATRRSTRSKRSVKVNLYLGENTDSSEDDASDYLTSNRSGSGRAQEKKPIRGRASRPAYGHFRSVADLDYDGSDDETSSLRRHRSICEKCHRGPAHQLVQAFLTRSKGKGKRRKRDEFEESSDDEEKFLGLGGWVRCLKCPVVAHWRCLASTQKEEILKAAKDKDRAELRRLHPPNAETLAEPEPSKRAGLDVYQTTEFICGACIRGGICMGCMEVALEPDTTFSKPLDAPPLSGRDIVMSDGTENVLDLPPLPVGGDDDITSTKELLFRCFTCKRVAHYAHLPLPRTLSLNDSVADIAQFYASTWLCADCASYRDGVDKIIAWRPYPPNAVEPSRSPDEPPNYKSSLPREYLVKWLDRSYKRVQWVPHMWLVSTHPAKLKNFLTGGSKVELLGAEKAAKVSSEEPASIFDVDDNSRASSVKPGTSTPSLPWDAIPDAENRIPPAWKTVDRVLDVLLWRPQQRSTRKISRKKKINRVESDDDDDAIDESINEERTLAFDHGEQPSEDLTETVSEWEVRHDGTFTLDHIDQVIWIFVKWGDLGYDEATWDSPPRHGEPGYNSFQTALKRFMDSREVIVLKHDKKYYSQFDGRAKDEYRSKHVLKDAADLDLGQDPKLKLMPFQVDGFNWLCNNWWNHQHCILADEMGLGKTVQIAAFLGKIMLDFKAFPALVVVPNSTISNWVREFERWAPQLRVVPFYGEAKARDVIKKFELLHETKRSGETGAKYHVLITTYEALLNPKDFTPVFRNQPRWEVLVIDEGQRLKSDSSLLFRRLNELNSIHRIIMTGTPLNNNIRELFNLMNFLDPSEWSDLEALEKEHEELTEDLVKQLHNRLRPYFLRRIKSEVLQLPPKNEVIVPVSMAPLQKQIYRSILSHNLELLKGLTQPSNAKLNSVVTKGRINNVLMQLRKCLQHPYLYDENIEPRGLSPQETHDKLIDGSAKLRFLKTLLPKLKERGHRVLLFSQFVIALNVIEDFLVGEGYKFLRLDGNTKGTERQKGMDEFNRPGSDIFIYLLTTRAGGVGINLFSADTVIIFDPDFNPHQDLQAIARAYRFGQQKTCLVFKLMVKDSAEERIVQVGKKKLVLDHLIVQKMDDEDSAGENVQSILTFGAQALFDSDQDSKDTTYTDQDIEKLIEKTEKEGEQEQPKEGAMSFSFAKIWAAEKDTLEEVEDRDQGDSWAQTLQKITTETTKMKSQEIAVSGRGARRRAAAMTGPNAYREGTPPVVKSKPDKKDESKSSEGSAYAGSGPGSEDEISDVSDDGPGDMTFEPPTKKRRNKLPLADVLQAGTNGNAVHIHQVSDLHDCGLCGKRHGDGLGECIMTEKSEHLAKFREMLLFHVDDEPWEERNAAVRAIDNTLYARGHITLIAGQPLYPLRRRPTIPPSAPKTPYNQPTVASGFSSPGIGAQAHNGHTSAVLHAMMSAQPRLQHPNAVAGPSKRPMSPPDAEEPSKKKKKLNAAPVGSECVICNRAHHLVKDCPLVTAGIESISQQIKRLENDTNSGVVHGVHVMRKLLLKYQKREGGGTGGLGV